MCDVVDSVFVALLDNNGANGHEPVLTTYSEHSEQSNTSNSTGHLNLIIIQIRYCLLIRVHLCFMLH